jgi:transposase
MRKTKEILRLKHELGLSNRQIAASLHLSHVCVANYLARASQAGVNWPLPAAITEDELRDLLFASATAPADAQRHLPSMAALHQQLRRKGVTLQLLWEEYRREHPDGYAYTQFCEHYNRFRSQLEPALRQEYKAGERLFVDWAGLTIALVDPQTGATRPAHLFVAVLGASNYTFAAAFENTQLPAWIEGHIQAWEFFGGVARLTVPDNTRTAVSQACRYEPELNATYQDLAAHYGTVILPARAGKPQDKAKVEAGVQNAERRIIAALRDRRFFSLGELQPAVRAELQALNERPFQKMDGSRATWFAQLDQPALLPLPAQRYELAVWQKAKANIDYHVQVDWHHYSVPYGLTNQPVEVRLSARVVEIFHRSQRVALHARSYQRGGFTTDPAHRPKSHQQHLEWSPTRLIHWAERQVGPHCAAAVRHILEHKPHPEMGYRSCLGLMRLGRRHSTPRLEQACQRALRLEVCSYRSIRSILDARLENQPLPAPTPASHPVTHANLRGDTYYR